MSTVAGKDLDQSVAAELDALREAGAYKRLNTLLSPQGPVVEMEGRGRVEQLPRARRAA